MVAKKKVLKKKTTAKKSTKQETSLHFVLEGRVLVEERLGKKVLNSSVIDGDSVLKILIEALESGLDSIELAKDILEESKK